MKSLRTLNPYFRKYLWLILLGSIFVIAQNFGAIYPARKVQQSIDEVVNYLKANKDLPVSPTLISTVSHTVFIFLLVIIGVAILRGVLMFLMRQTIIVMSRRIEFDLKNDIYYQYQKLSLAFYRRNNTGDLMNRISEDVSRVRMYLGPAIMYTINLVVLFILIMFTMMNVNRNMTIYILLPLPILSLSIYYVSDRMNRKSEEVQQQQSRLSTYVQEAFSGIRILKSFVKEESSVKSFQLESAYYMSKNMELARVNSFFFPLMTLLVGLSTLLTVYVGGNEVIAGRATYGNIAEFLIYVTMLTFPMASLGWVTSLVQRASASQERINEFLHLKPEIISPDVAPQKLSGKVEFDHVSFVYPESGIRALDNISFTVMPGKSLAILGKTGSGKSTLANLLLRMFDPVNGRILLDDIPLNERSLSSVREQIGYVPQEVFLFSDSIANNIAFGLHDRMYDEQVSSKLIEDAARKAVIHDNIIDFPAAYQTMIGERGITLSGGQKQRISIARALIKQPVILLFDDCLSAVDTHTEEMILRNLDEAMKNRTSIIISHRVSSIKNADHILVLDNGKIVEEGTHEQLMNMNAVYRAMYEQQMLEEMTK